jgi:hypothetical protein
MIWKKSGVHPEQPGKNLKRTGFCLLRKIGNIWRKFSVKIVKGKENLSLETICKIEKVLLP